MEPVAIPSLPDPTEVITGPRVLLRGWQADDAPLLWEAIEESRARIGQWMSWVEGHDSPAVSVDYCRKMAELWAQGGGFALGIWHRESGRLLGASGLHNADWDVPSAEIGYWLREGAVGHGYAEEAVRLQLDFAFDRLGMNRVALTCDPENARSRRIPEAIGFTLEGHLRNHLRMPPGGLRDTLVYSMLPDEWRAKRGGQG